MGLSMQMSELLQDPATVPGFFVCICNFFRYVLAHVVASAMSWYDTAYRACYDRLS